MQETDKWLAGYLIHNTDTGYCHCCLRHTNLHVADVQNGSKKKETEKKKIIRKNSNRQRKEESTSSTCYEKDDTKIKYKSPFE